MTLTDTLPAGVTFESATPTQGSCSEASGTVTCALGTLADGATRERRDQGARRRPPARSPTRRASPPTPTTRSPATTPPAPRRPSNAAADLSLTKTDSPDPVLAGELLTYTLTAHNAGPQDATGVTLTDTLPGGVTFDSATPSQGSCSQASGTVTCALGTIADEGTATIQILVRPSAPGTMLQPGKRRPRSRRPEHREQLRHRPDDRHRGARRLPASQRGLPRFGLRSSRPTTNAQLPTGCTGRRLTPRRATHPRSGRAS